MKLHWIATSNSPTTTSEVTAVRLDAGLSGPFASVAELKAANGPATITAPGVVAAATSDGAPVSIIHIPRNAPEGYYDLTTTVGQDGGRQPQSGGSVIRVEVP